MRQGGVVLDELEAGEAVTHARSAPGIRLRHVGLLSGLWQDRASYYNLHTEGRELLQFHDNDPQRENAQTGVLPAIYSK